MSEYVRPVLFTTQDSIAGKTSFYDSKVLTFTLACYFLPDSRYYDVR